MTFWAIVPVKPLRWGKSRLAEVLTDDERSDLNHRLLAHTLATLSVIPDIEQVLVISRDQGALALARSYGARSLLEGGAPQLNVALQRATIVAKTFAARGIVVVPADLPLITAEDVRTMLSLAQDPPVVVVAPDRHRTGTNALSINPAGLIQYKFGKDSFQQHCSLALAAGARLEICELSSLSLDVDLPEDLQMVSENLEKYLGEFEGQAAYSDILRSLCS